MTSSAISLKEYFAIGGQYTDKDAAVIGPAIQRISHDGVAAPTALVASGESQTSPIHRYFVWDNDVAGPLYRLEQAKGMLRAVKVRVAEREPETRQERRPTSVPATDRGVVQIRRTDGEVAEQIAKGAMAALQEFTRTFAPYRFRWDAFEAKFGAVLDQIERCQNKTPPTALNTLATRCIQCGKEFIPKHARHRLCEAC